MHILSTVILFVQQIRLPKKEGRNAPSFSRSPCRPLPIRFSTASRCWSTLVSRATRLRAAQEFGVARSYTTLVGLGDGHCLVAFCLALLMDILYRKVRLLSTVILFVEQIRLQLPARIQLATASSCSSFQLPTRRRQRAPGRARTSRAHRCADRPLGRSGPFGCLYYTTKGLFCQALSYLLNE